MGKAFAWALDLWCVGLGELWTFVGWTKSNDLVGRVVAALRDVIGPFLWKSNGL